MRVRFLQVGRLMACVLLAIACQPPTSASSVPSDGDGTTEVPREEDDDPESVESTPGTPLPETPEEDCPAMACRYEPCPPGVEPPEGCLGVCGCAGMQGSDPIQVVPAQPEGPARD